MARLLTYFEKLDLTSLPCSTAIIISWWRAFKIKSPKILIVANSLFIAKLLLL